MLCAMEEVWGTGFEDGLNPELQYLDHLQVCLTVGQSTLLSGRSCGSADSRWFAWLPAASSSVRRFQHRPATTAVAAAVRWAFTVTDTVASVSQCTCATR